MPPLQMTPLAQSGIEQPCQRQSFPQLCALPQPARTRTRVGEAGASVLARAHGTGLGIARGLTGLAVGGGRVGGARIVRVRTRGCVPGPGRGVVGLRQQLGREHRPAPGASDQGAGARVRRETASRAPVASPENLEVAARDARGRGRARDVAAVPREDALDVAALELVDDAPRGRAEAAGPAPSTRSRIAALAAVRRRRPRVRRPLERAPSPAARRRGRRGARPRCAARARCRASA